MPLIARASIDLGAPESRYLNCNVRGRSKTVQSKPSAVLDIPEAQASEADDPGAQQGRGREISKPLRDRIDEAFFRQRIFCVATIHCVASKAGMVAKIFLTGLAIFASSVGGV